MNKTKKKIFVSIILSGASLSALFAASQVEKASFVNTRAASQTLELVDLLAGKSITDGIVSYTMNDYEYKFYANNVTFAEDKITIADGGYLKNLTAYNTIQLFDVAGTLNNMILSGGKMMAVFSGKELCRDHYYEGVNGSLSGDTHFVIEADGGDVILTTLDLRYDDCTTTGTDTSEGVSYSHYTWKFKGLGTSASPYLINNLEDWNVLVSESQNYIFLDKYFKLTADITGVTSPVAPSNSKRFAGHVDGDGHSVTVNISSSAAVSIGLFGYVTSESSISNMTLKGSIKQTNNGNGVGTGGFVGNVYNVNGKTGRFINLINEATVTGNTQRAAGIISSVTGAIYVENCINRGAISATGSLYVGGICGVIQSGVPVDTEGAVQLLKVSNEASVVGNKADSAGGIVGRIGGANYFVDITYYSAYGELPVVASNAVTSGGRVTITQLS